MFHSVNRHSLVACCVEIEEDRNTIKAGSVLWKTSRLNGQANMYWVFIGRTDVEAETPILWPPDVKS